MALTGKMTLELQKFQIMHQLKEQGTHNRRMSVMIHWNRWGRIGTHTIGYKIHYILYIMIQHCILYCVMCLYDTVSTPVSPILKRCLTQILKFRIARYWTSPNYFFCMLGIYPCSTRFIGMTCFSCEGNCPKKEIGRVGLRTLVFKVSRES
jgi:hypothetical protein